MECKSDWAWVSTESPGAAILSSSPQAAILSSSPGAARCGQGLSPGVRRKETPPGDLGGDAALSRSSRLRALTCWVSDRAFWVHRNHRITESSRLEKTLKTT